MKEGADQPRPDSRSSSLRKAGPKRILFVNHVSAAGGAEASLLESLRALPRERFTPLAVLPGPGPLADRLARLGVPVFYLPFRRFRRTLNPLALAAAAWSILVTAGRLARLVRRERIDLLHANSATAHLYAGRAAARAGIPCVWHCRDLVDLGRLEPWLMRSASAVIAISDAVSRHLQRTAPSGKVVVIPNALDAAAFAAGVTGKALRAEWGFPPEAYVVGMAAQLTPWKRHDLFVQAAARIAAVLPEARFVLAGDSSLEAGSAWEDQIRRMIGEAGLGDRLVLAGHRTDMPDVLAAFDVLVHPAEREPLGRVILEGMALGKPVVAAESAGPAEILAGGAGLLVRPGDPAALADAVLGLRRAPARAAALGHAGKARLLAAYAPAAHVSKIETLYRRLLPDRVVAMVVAEFPSVSETFILREMQALEARGVRVIPVTLGPARPGPVHRDALPFLDRVVQLPVSRRVYGPAAALIAAGRLRRAGVGRVHAHFAWTTAEVGRRVAHLLGVPFSVSVHARDLFVQSPEALRARLEGADAVIACTRQGLERVRACWPDLPGERLVLARHGVFPDRYPGARPDSPHILAVGRLEEKKGFRFLVEACRLMKQRGYAFRCTVVGEGSLRPALERQIAEAGLGERVRLAGALTQELLLEQYGNAMVMAVPSVEGADGDRDGIPNVILEAMAMGIPLAASAAGAIPEAVADGVQGRLVAPGNATALANALSGLLADPEARRRMGAQGRATVCREFDADRNAGILAGLFGCH